MQHDKFSRLKVLPVCNFSYSPLPNYYTKISANCNFIGNSIKDATPPHLFALHFYFLPILFRAGLIACRLRRKADPYAKKLNAASGSASTVNATGVSYITV